jgi:hypothetical protein
LRPSEYEQGRNEDLEFRVEIVSSVVTLLLALLVGAFLFVGGIAKLRFAAAPCSPFAGVAIKFVHSRLCIIGEYRQYFV